MPARPTPHLHIGPKSCLNSVALSPDIASEAAYSQWTRAPVLQADQEFVITTEIHRFLLETYINNIHCLYPFLDNTSPPLTLVTQSLTTPEPWQEFMSQMVYSVACYCIDQDCYRSLGLESYRRAMKYIDRATASTTVESLQAVIILAVHGLFQPQHGNVSQLIGFAARLMMDIERYCQNQGAPMYHIYTTLYSLENQFASVLDRPTLLPEWTDQIQEDKGPGHARRMEERTETSSTANKCQVEITASDTSSLNSLVYFLYQIQNRFRNGDHGSAALLFRRLSLDPTWPYVESSLHPNIRAVFYETYLLVDSTPATACRLVSTYAMDSYVCNCLTAHWAYRAGMTILGRAHLITDVELAKGCSDCILVLENCFRSWPGSRLLKQAVISCMDKMKRGH